MSLADKLNELQLVPIAKQGRVTLAYGYPYEPAETESAELGVVDGYLDSHPEGADRGGYVPYVFTDSEQAYYCDGACEWFED